jgi:membrane protein
MEPSMSLMSPIKNFFTNTRVGLFLYILAKRFFNEGCTYRASSLVYTTLLGVIPFVFISITLLSWLPGYHLAGDSLSRWMSPLLTASQMTQVHNLIAQFLVRIKHLSWLNVSFLVISCVLMINSMASALNAIWQTHKPRSEWLSALVYVVTVVVGPLSMGTVSIGWALIKHWPYLEIVQQVHWLVVLADTIVPYVIIGLLLTLLNVVLPSGRVPWLAAMISAACTVLFFIVIKWFFVAIILNRPTYHILYGNLALFPLMMLWIYLIWVVVLLGALIGYNFANGLSLQALKRLADES